MHPTPDTQSSDNMSEVQAKRWALTFVHKAFDRSIEAQAEGFGLPVEEYHSNRRKMKLLIYHLLTKGLPTFDSGEDGWGTLRLVGRPGQPDDPCTNKYQLYIDEVLSQYPDDFQVTG